MGSPKTNVRFGFHELIFPSHIISIWICFSSSLSMISLCTTLSVTKYTRDLVGTYSLSSAASTMWCLWEPFLKLAASQLSGEFRSAWMALLVLKIVSFCSCKTIIRCYFLTASQVLGSKCCKDWGHTQHFSYLVCLCLLYLYPGLLVLSIVFFLFLIRENPESFSYPLICKYYSSEYFAFISFMRKKSWSAFCSMNFFCLKARDRASTCKTYCCPVKHKEKRVTNGEDLIIQNEIMHCFPMKITVSTVWISIRRNKAKIKKYNIAGTKDICHGSTQSLLNEYTFRSSATMCIKT